MKKMLTMIAASAAIIFSGCAGSAAPAGQQANTNLMQLVTLKDEYVAAGGIADVGEGIATKEMTALSQAQMYARANIAGQMNVKSQQLQKAWNEEIGNKDGLVSADAHQEQVNKEIISEQISGASTVKMITEIQPDGRYKVTVLMAMSPDNLAKFAEALKNSEAVSSAIRERVTSSYKAADDELKKYDEFKNRANNIN